MRVTRMIWYAGTTMLTALAMLAASATAAAQQRARTPHARAGAIAADSSRAERERAANLKSFLGMGIAAQLHTTPEALAAAYERARQTNPKLNRGQFIAANVLAANLGAEHPSITTQAILSGLQSGRSIGQTLRSLGLSAYEAKAATRTADRQRNAAAQRAKAAESSLKSFRGIAARLNTTPEALAHAFEHAREANPKLSRGNFIAANVLADNLGARHPNVTTPAILAGLQSGKSVGQTLQSLGLSASEAKQARRAAGRQATDAENRVRDTDKRAQAESRAAKQKSRRVSR